MKIFTTLKALWQMEVSTKTFNSQEVFNGKKVAVIGAADSAYLKENSDYINSFDVIVRINKALFTWKPEHEKFVGRRTEVLFHSFYENEISGGGPITTTLLKKHGVKFLVHPLNDWKGFRTRLNFYKRHPEGINSFVLRRKNYLRISKELDGWIPTVGFCALETVLRSNCKEIYITGFTFFKTPYVDGYRDNLSDKEKNKMHIEKQGRHNPEKEFRVFSLLLKRNKKSKIICDNTLSKLLNSKN